MTGPQAGGACQKQARATRAADNRVLDWLRLSLGGATSARIAAESGTTAAFVRASIKRVRDADFAESGEPEDVVKRGYA